jgi:hypothetical protein
MTIGPTNQTVDYHGLETTILGLQSDVVSLQADIATLQGDVDDLTLAIEAADLSDLEILADAASPGLSSAFSNSLAYRIAEIERHFHSYERWLGVGGETENLFVIDGGNLVFGSWTEILTAGMTPVIAGATHFDLHRVMVADCERTAPYRVQFAFGSDPAAAYTAGDFTELVYSPNLTSQDRAPMDINSRRKAAGTRVWARCRVNADTGTFSFLLGIHEYEG